MNAEYSNIDPSKQHDEHTAFMYKAALCCLLQVFLAQFRHLVAKRRERYMGSGIVKETLAKVLVAPVNLFFDVTPVGKILKIFQEEINIFRNHLFDPLKHIIGMLSHVVLVSAQMMLIGFWESLIGFIFIGIVLG